MKTQTIPMPHLNIIPSLQAIDTVYTMTAEVVQKHLTANGEVAPKITFLRVPAGAAMPDKAFTLPASLTSLYFDTPAGKTILGELFVSIFDHSDPERERLIGFLGFTPNLINVVSEAWVTALPMNTKVENIENSMHEFGGIERTEAVLFQFHSERGSMTCVCPMSRDENDKPSMTITPFDGSASVAGRMSLASENNLAKGVLDGIMKRPAP